MTIAPITDHVSAALRRLLTQLQARPVLSSLITTLAIQCQLFEDAFGSVSEGCFLANAQGAQLDGIGSVCGIARGGQPDALYRLFILGRIAANSSKATHETLLTLAQNLFEAKSASLRGSFPPGGAPYRAPMAIGLEVGSPALDPSYYNQALALLKQAMAAGVALSYLVKHQDAQAFALDGPTPGLGFASDDGTTTAGGALAQDLYTSTVS